MLRLDHTPIEDPGPGQVQVAVRACGLNFADISVRLGLYKAAQGLYPLCPGLELAGIVRAVGKDVSAFREGDRVFGATRFGGYASVVNCPPGAHLEAAGPLGIQPRCNLPRRILDGRPCPL